MIEYYLNAVRSRVLRSVVPLLDQTDKPGFVVLDPGLIATVGHHREFAAMIRAELGSRYRVRIYGNFRAALDVIVDVRALPIFHDDLYVRWDDTRAFPDTYADMSRTLANALAQVSTADLGPAAIALMHTATVFQLGGLAEWYGRLPPERRPKLLIQFQHGLAFGVKPASAVPAAIEAARDAAATLVSASPAVRFTSNSDVLSAELAGHLAQRCDTLPLPIRWPSSMAITHVKPDCLFGFFGGLRREKGAELLAEALPVFLARYPDVRCLVHAPAGPSDERSVDRLSRLPQVELVREAFEEKDDYFKAFARARCILLPYDPAAYAIRTSGIVLEALGLGKTIVTTDRTWLAGQVTRWGGRGFLMNGFTVDALLEQMEAAAQALRMEPAESTPDLDVVRECSPHHFCEAIVEAVERSAASTSLFAASTSSPYVS